MYMPLLDSGTSAPKSSPQSGATCSLPTDGPPSYLVLFSVNLVQFRVIKCNSLVVADILLILLGDEQCLKDVDNQKSHRSCMYYGKGKVR